MDEEELAMAMATAAASSECSSGCQSGWTTYLDDHSSSYSLSCGAARYHTGNGKPYYCDDDYSEEDDLSMISDASSGPRHQSSAGNDVEGLGVGGAAAARANAERRGRRESAAAAVARRQSKRAAAAASLLEDTASSPAFFGYSKAMGSGEANGYGVTDATQMMEIANAADFSYAFSTTTTGFKSPLNGTALGGYMQMHSPAPVNPMMPTRQVCRDAPEKKRW